MKEFDLIVIGAGSGLEVASGYANRGNDVAVIEPGPLGGTCLNRGCIPSKMLIHRADVAEEIRGSEKFGVESEINDIDFNCIIEEINSEVSGDAENIKKGLENSDRHTLFREEAEFVDEKLLEVGDEEIASEKIVIAAGSRPFKPPIDGLDEIHYWTSKEALNPDYRPERLIMIGGGYISLELAHFYDAMGTDVTILERGDKLLKREDSDISGKITEIAKRRYNVNLGLPATEVREKDGEKIVVAETEDGEQKDFRTDELLVAAGRVSNTDKLNVEEQGFETTDGGFLKTDEHMETNVEGVYALGDIADNWMFKHSANYEAGTVYRNIVTDNDYEVGQVEMPHAVFTSPQIASIGKTEQELNEDGTDYVKSKYDYSDTGMGMALKAENGYVKLLASEKGKILGCHIIGPEASTLIHEVIVAKQSGSGNISDIKDAIHVHPALSEVVQRAFNQI
ncbi:MAG: dihydrolipoamide dehydrogenase [Nanohaloarchaea archaeon SW_7_43_1]|nr:MAG: dihydrolipoamide dehydrogenase [Nanohaloarchaea archaeon SW_7_43_1]